MLRSAVAATVRPRMGQKRLPPQYVHLSEQTDVRFIYLHDLDNVCRVGSVRRGSYPYVCAGQALHDTVFFFAASQDGKYYV